MIDKIKEFVVTLTEDVKYYDNVFQYYKSLESTLWGLEEQAKFPENSPQEDQEQLNVEITKSRNKLSNCKKLLDSQLVKINDLIKGFTPGCGGCH